MNDDHMDGWTAFPYLKLRIRPTEGSALFWFTLKHSGANEYGTRFTQCPVMYKGKWIAYKHIYEGGQEVCELKEGDAFGSRIEDYDKSVF
jgi:hypothetical protein